MRTLNLNEMSAVSGGNGEGVDYVPPAPIPTNPIPSVPTNPAYSLPTPGSMSGLQNQSPNLQLPPERKLVR
jgi:hypothetical protein